jgi:hypothetical protein
VRYRYVYVGGPKDGQALSSEEVPVEQFDDGRYEWLGGASIIGSADPAAPIPEATNRSLKWVPFK